MYKMMNVNEALALVLSGVEQTMAENGFSVLRPESTKKGEPPVHREEESLYLDFAGDRGRFRIEASGKRLILSFAEEPDAQELVRLSVNYFDMDSFDERDIRSLCNELNESIRSKVGVRAVSSGKGRKMPVPVSKSAAKNGVQAYDGNTLASRLSAVYQELKEPYRENFERYGTFLAEEFFTQHANARMLETIRRNDKKEMNRLFRLLNEIYENGANDTQSLVAVTILGELNGDPKLLEAAVPYMCDDLRETALLVNRVLTSGKSGKRLREKLKNPPPYKPKKEKKPGFLEQMMGAGQPPPPAR